jgi:multidrug efflux pump subunit AcrB
MTTTSTTRAVCACWRRACCCRLDWTLSLGSLIGFVTLFGITLRNSIKMISHYEHLVGVEGMNRGLETALRGASERPRTHPDDGAGDRSWPPAACYRKRKPWPRDPMALVILGGLVTSTALNLLVLPTLALRYGRFGRVTSEQ